MMAMANSYSLEEEGIAGAFAILKPLLSSRRKALAAIREHAQTTVCQPQRAVGLAGGLARIRMEPRDGRAARQDERIEPRNRAQRES